MPPVMPYETSTFSWVHNGDIENTIALLRSETVSIYIMDPYGLSLLYVGSTTRAPVSINYSPL